MEPAENYSYHVLQSLKRNPAKTILAVGDNDSITCEHFYQRVSALSCEFKRCGMKPNHRVILTVRPSTDLYCIAIAIWTTGASLVIVDTAMGLERINHCIAISSPHVWIRPNGLLYKALPILLPSLRAVPTVIDIDDTLPASKLVAPDEVIPVKEVLVTFTTGSTGMPKLIARDHSFLLQQSKALSTFFKDSDELELEEVESVFATNLPVFPLHFLKVGAMCILIPKFTKCDPAIVLKLLKNHNTTVLTGSPYFLHRLAQYAAKHHIMLPVKYTAIGGAPVYHSMFRTIALATPGKMAAVVYGSTEAEPMCMLLAKEKMELEAPSSRGLCVGKPLLKARMAAINILEEPVTEAVDVVQVLGLPAGEIGELVINGWHVNTFHVDPKRLITDKDGSVWLRTEDVGYIDEEGRIWLVGRAKWRITDPKTGTVYWSTIVEQEVLDRCSLITFVTYLPHNGKAWLFIEAPNGLPEKEETALRSFLKQRGIPVDELIIKPHIAKDHRHNSKPNTGALFNINNAGKLSAVKFILKANLVYLIPIILFIILLLYWLL